MRERERAQNDEKKEDDKKDDNDEDENSEEEKKKFVLNSEQVREQNVSWLRKCFHLLSFYLLLSLIFFYLPLSSLPSFLLIKYITLSGAFVIVTVFMEKEKMKKEKDNIGRYVVTSYSFSHARLLETVILVHPLYFPSHYSHLHLLIIILRRIMVIFHPEPTPPFTFHTQYCSN